jgi:hypothetical protein
MARWSSCVLTPQVQLRACPAPSELNCYTSSHQRLHTHLAARLLQRFVMPRLKFLCSQPLRQTCLRTLSAGEPWAEIERLLATGASARRCGSGRPAAAGRGGSSRPTLGHLQISRRERRDAEPQSRKGRAAVGFSSWSAQSTKLAQRAMDETTFELRLLERDQRALIPAIADQSTLIFPTIMALPASAGIARWDTVCSEPDCSTQPERAFRCFDLPVTRSTRDLKVAERRAVGPPRPAVAGSAATTEVRSWLADASWSQTLIHVANRAA